MSNLNVNQECDWQVVNVVVNRFTHNEIRSYVIVDHPYMFTLFVSLLSSIWLCQAPCVQSHKRQPMSAVAITASEVQVSAADSQTVPTVVTGVSKPLCCRLTLTFTLTSEYLSLCTILLLFLHLLVLIQLCSPRCWHLDYNYCRTRCRQSQLRFVLSPLILHPCLLEMFQSDIPLFMLTWPAKHSPYQGWESTHR